MRSSSAGNWDLAKVLSASRFQKVKPNIDKKGRVARGGIAVVFLLAGACLIPEAAVFGAIFIAIGLFCAFEAWIGWCAVRACGVKTPL